MIYRIPWVRSLGREGFLEKGMETHSSTLAWRIPWTEEPGGLQSTGSQRVGHDWVTSTLTFAVILACFWGITVLFPIVTALLYIPTKSV